MRYGPFPFVAFGIVALVALRTACTPARQQAEMKPESIAAAQRRPSSPPAAGDPIPPQTCRMTGSVLQIEPPAPGGDLADPCSGHPCLAFVRIDSVVGYGSSFPQPLAPGERVMARFAFTLDPSADVFPAMQPSLPGLRVGSAFQADVEGVASPPPGGGDSLRIVVREYRVLLK